jgi:hypothetical protein
MSIVTLTGRRIDAPGSNTNRFPKSAVPAVRVRVHDELKRLGATALVASAACGADLIALDVAGELGLRRRIVLPFAETRFRETSVVDRGAEWGPIYDRILTEVKASDDVVTLQDAGADDSAAYLAANVRLLDEAQSLGRAAGAEVVVMLVKENRPGYEGIDRQFADDARQRGLRVVEVASTET